MSRLMPALSDGRAFTSYLSAGQREQKLQYALKVTNENQYRAKLQHDARAVEALLSRMVVPPPLPGPAVAAADPAAAEPATPAPATM